MKLKISNQQITIIEPLVLVADTENVYECEYVFDEEWEGFNKTAVFEGCGSTYQVVLTNTQKCKIPNEVIADSGYVRFGVLGTKVVGSITQRYPTVWSERVWVDVASIGTGTPQPPTAEVYAQILANEGAIEDRLDEAEDDIEALDAGKVDKVEGKGLSTNDYTNVEKQKVADAYADKHTHSNKGILDAISQTLVDAWNNAVTWIATNGSNVLSHLSNTTVHTTANEKATWNAKQNHLTAGQNITIENDVISASGGGGGTSDFEQLTNRPKYAGNTMDKNTNIPSVPTKTSDLTNDSGFLTEHQSLVGYATELWVEAKNYITNAVNNLTNYYLKSETYSKNEVDTTVSSLQPKTDNLLSTTSKQVVGAINEIDAMIPAQASAENQLADKEFTNSSIATNTAHYIHKTVGGEKVPFDSVAELEAYSGTVTQNDYAFVQGTDSEGNAYYDRYKADVVGTTHTWAKEYRLNNSSFTAQQWSAIQSGITSGLVALIGTALQPSALTPYRTASAQDVIDAGKVGFTDYPVLNGRAGAIKIHTNYADELNDGTLCAVLCGYPIYQSRNDWLIVGKGTLETVLDNESLRIDKTQSLSSAQKSQAYSNLGAVSSQGVPIATSISSSSTHNEVVSAKAVADYVEKPMTLVETITISESTVIVQRTNLNYKHIAFISEIPIASSASGGGVRINGTTNDYLVYNQSSISSVSNSVYWNVFADCEHGLLRTGGVVATSKTSNTNLNKTTAELFTDKITSYQIFLNSGFPVGTVIRVYAC